MTRKLQFEQLTKFTQKGRFSSTRVGVFAATHQMHSVETPERAGLSRGLNYYTKLSSQSLRTGLKDMRFASDFTALPNIL